MGDEMKLLRAFIEAQGYEIEELDAKPDVKQNTGYPIIFDGGNYKVTKKVDEKVSFLDVVAEDFKQKLKSVEYSSYKRAGFGESIL